MLYNLQAFKFRFNLNYGKIYGYENRARARLHRVFFSIPPGPLIAVWCGAERYQIKIRFGDHRLQTGFSYNCHPPFVVTNDCELTPRHRSAKARGRWGRQVT